MLKYLVVFYFGFILFTNTVADIAINYYYGNDRNLRTTSGIGTCLTEDKINYCYEKCGPKHACLLGQCLCVIAGSEPDEPDEPDVLKSEFRATLLEESDEDVSDSDEDYYDSSGTVEYPMRPSLRHHIAHFCPNLEIARLCIRKCMKVAKPAFCGKDHVCYCGHRYSPTDRDPKLSVADVHNQYRDLYEKYFGLKRGHTHKDHGPHHKKPHRPKNL